MHAAASYAHTELLEYLISVGGDINLRDDDGDTPLYVVETVEMARWMIERGADWSVVNEEGLSVSLISYPMARRDRTSIQPLCPHKTG
jgi:ankyrin repeat protein